MKPDFVLLDDDEITLLIQKRLITRYELGNTVHTFLNCDDFIGFIGSNQFSPGGTVIMLDINMPQCSGWDCISIIESAKIQMPVEIFIVTSSIDPADLEKAGTYPTVNAVISKPVDLTSLMKYSNLLQKQIV
jgi:CheY-like chemotaxis protein